MAGLKNNYQFEFTDTLTTSGMSVRISNEKENGAVATFTDQYVTARSEDNSIVERMKGSASAGVLTLSMRGLDQTDTDTQVPGLKRERREGTKVFVTYVASQHVDAKGNNTFSGTQTFENITVSNNSALTNATVSGKYKGPVVADVIARDALYPTPVGGNEVFVQSLNAKQVYNAGTSQRETQAVGTPAPDASETVKGIAEIATQAEVDAGTSDTTIVTPLKLKTQQPEALVDKNTYILGEDCLVNDSLFPETAPTFAESTTVQNIGDVTANTRVVLYDFGSGVAGSTIKLALRKFVSPSADLAIRLETLDGSGNPTGTLVHANATATVTAASLTTSLKPYLTINSNISDSNGLTKPDTTSGIVGGAGFRIYTKERLEINSVTKNGSSTASRALVKTDIGNTILATATFSGNVATFSSTVILDKNIHYRIEVDNNGGGRTSRDNVFGTPTYPVNLTNINYVGGSSGGGNYSKSPDIETINTSAIQDLTFAGSFAITLGQKYAIVLNQVGNVVNGTNYYGIGYVARDTTTRGRSVFNGAVRNPTGTNDGTNVLQNIGTNPTNLGGTHTVKYGVNITMNQKSYLTSVTKSALTTATTAYLLDGGGATIATATFSGNIATFSPQTLTSGLSYSLVVDSGGSPYTAYINNAFTYPNVYTRFTTTSGYGTFGSTRLYCLTDITTQGETFINGQVNSDRFYYRASALAIPTVLSKTSATYSYKLPTDFPRIANEAKSAGQNVITSYYGLKGGFTGLSPVTYYVSNTPGLISATAGTNPYIVGQGIDSTTIKIDGKNINKPITVGASPFNYVNSTGGPIQVRITGGTVNPIVINGVTVATATGIIDTLPAGAVMTVTYTVLPTITYSDL